MGRDHEDLEECPKMSEHEAEEVIKLIDNNNDGKIDYEEFLSMMLEMDNEQHDSDHEAAETAAAAV